MNTFSIKSINTSILNLQDKVVIQRLDQLCECVLKGEWPIVSKVADALLQNQLVANSPLSGGYPSLGDVEMASLPPGFAIGEDGQPEDPSKAFKLKRVSVCINILLGFSTASQYGYNRS